MVECFSLFAGAAASLACALGGQLLPTDGNADEESGSEALPGTLRPDRSTVQRDELLGDVEAQARAFRPVLPADLPPLEALEERLCLLRVEPWPRILHAHNEVVDFP